MAQPSLAAPPSIGPISTRTQAPRAVVYILSSFMPEEFTTFGAKNPHLNNAQLPLRARNPRRTLTFVHGSLLTEERLDHVLYDIVNGSFLGPPCGGNSAPPVVPTLHGR
jgi:hypothetical protein